MHCLRTLLARPSMHYVKFREVDTHVCSLVGHRWMHRMHAAALMLKRWILKSRMRERNAKVAYSASWKTMPAV
jgi:hypothetical protein